MELENPEVAQLRSQLFCLNNLSERLMLIEHSLGVGSISEDEADQLVEAMNQLAQGKKEPAGDVEQRTTLVPSEPPAAGGPGVSYLAPRATSEPHEKFWSDIHDFAWNVPRSTIIDPTWPKWAEEA